MKTQTFKYGGIHPPDKKHLCAEVPTERMPLPTKVNMSLWQHLGKPATPLVERKAVVEEGARIAEAAGFVSAHIHAPISGTVGNVVPSPPPLGRNQLAVEIKRDEAIPAKTYTRNDSVLETLSNEEIVARIKECGIVGMGGAMFPAHVKLSPPPEKRITNLIVNAVECEPYINSDYRLMLEHADEIIAGLNILRKIFPVDHIYIGIEINRPKAIEAIKKACAAHPPIEVVPLKIQYPQGGEKQLIQAITGKEVPAGGLPMDIGMLVHNVATIYAIYEAVYMNKPLIERIVTVSGEAIKEPKNLWVRFGTPVEDIITYCGGLTQEHAIVVNGGPMMGFALPSLSQSIVKGTNAILALRDKHRIVSDRAYQCIRCNRCVENCPVNLVPRDIGARARIQDTEKMVELDIFSCIDCGACAYSCPARIPLVQRIRVGKQYIRAKQSN